jgi:hypothetical protein
MIHMELRLSALTLTSRSLRRSRALYTAQLGFPLLDGHPIILMEQSA